MMEKKKKCYVENGIVLGFILGVAIGLVFFDQIILSGAIGMCFGIVIGAIMDNQEKKSLAN